MATNPAPPEESTAPEVVLNPRKFTPSEAYVAVLDALGAKGYTKPEVEKYLAVRDKILADVKKAAEKQGPLLDAKNFRIFVFNDTVIFAYLTPTQAPAGFVAFCRLLRGVQTASLAQSVFFRGAISLGLLYEADNERNTIMGPALSEAASWYERADWIGVNATPRATIQVRSWLHTTPDEMDYLLVDYDVPLKGGRRMSLKALNWPKALYLAVNRDVKQARSFLFSLFTSVPMPDGTESKYLSTMQFFDECDKRGLLMKKSDE